MFLVSKQTFLICSRNKLFEIMVLSLGPFTNVIIRKFKKKTTFQFALFSHSPHGNQFLPSKKNLLLIFSFVSMEKSKTTTSNRIESRIECLQINIYRTILRCCEISNEIGIGYDGNFEGKGKAECEYKL